ARRRGDAVDRDVAVVHLKDAVDGVRGKQDAGRRSGIKIHHVDVIEIERVAGDEIDADQPVAYSVDRQAPQVHRDTRPIDVDAIGERRQNRAERPTAVDRDRLRDRKRAEATRVEAVDLAAGRRLGDRTRKGLAWRRARAWVGVIADAGYPGPRRLG